MIKIYKVTGPKNKIYIGITKKDLKKRIREHHSAARCGSTYQFHRALRYYSDSAFKWEIIATARDRMTAKNLEIKFIKKFDSLLSGYNCTAGGDGCNREWSEEQKQKMSIKKKAQYLDPDFRKNLKFALRKSITPERRKTMSEHAKKIWADPIVRAKFVKSAKLRSIPGEMRRRQKLSVQMRMSKAPLIKVWAKNGMFIGEWKSKEECAAKLNLHERSVYRYLDGARTPKNYIIKAVHV